MKGKFKRIGILFIIIGFFIFGFVSCGERNLKIKELNIDAVIMPNGDVNVEEIFDYRFNGEFQGVFREYYGRDCDGYIINNISIIDKDGNEKVVELSESEEPNTYTLKSEYGAYIKIFTPSKNERKKIKINYTAKGAAKKYSDCSALYWSFYTVSKEEKVGKGTLKISLNEGVFNEDLFYKIYGDGSIKGKISPDKSSLNIKFSRLSGMIGAQLKFQREYLNDEANFSFMTFDKALSMRISKFQEGISRGEFLLILLIGGTIIAIIYGFVKLFKKISKIRFEKALAKYRSKINDIKSVKFYDNHYNIPSDISPAYINLISLDFKKDNLAIIDVMMYLVNKGVYSIEKEKNLIFKYCGDNRIKEDNHLENIINWMNEYDNGNGIDLKKLHNTIKKEEYAIKYVRAKRSYGDAVIKDAIENKIITKIKGRYVVSNEFYYQWEAWENYKNALINVNKEYLITAGESVPVALIYGIALGLSNKELNSLENVIREVMNKSIIFEEKLRKDLNNISTAWLVSRSFNNLNLDAVRIYNNSSSNGSVSSSGSFSGGGGGSSGGF